MPSFKPVVRKDVINSDGKANIKIRVSHDKKVSYIATKWYIDPRHMGSNGKVKPSYPGYMNLNQDLMLLEAEYNKIAASIGSMDLIACSVKFFGFMLVYLESK